MDQIVDIATEGRHLSRDRGFLKVSEDGAEIGRTPLNQIAGVIVHAYGTTWTTSLLVELAERGAPVVLAKWQAKAPLLKQAWKQVIVAKVRMQAAALAAIGEPDAPLRMMVRKITSGDGGNIEAQAARHYWPRMMGTDFRRDTGGDGANALLNYGYTVLRAATARSVVAAGLQPTIGLFHSNRGSAFALADDLMEPFRPLVDSAVRGIAAARGSDVDTEAKHALARLIAIQSFETEKLSLALPTPPDALTFAGLGK